MTYPRNAQPAPAGSGGADAEKAAFLRDLRALRDHAGLGSRDLAARAHFPEDTLKTAEAGPALPSLPVLQAYVRGCGAGETEWEDRWRRLNSDSTSSGGNALPTRAPSAARPPARVMPFPDQDDGPSAAEQDAIGFGLARVVRGLAPIDPGAAPGGSSEGGGWFDPVPKAPPAASPSSGSLFTPATPASPAPPASPAASAPEVNPGEPTLQYPALSGYQAPEAPYPGSYQNPGYEPPAYEPPEMFRTPTPEPPSPPAPAAPGSGSTFAGLGTQAPMPPARPAPPAPPAAGSAAPPVAPGSAGRGLGSEGPGLGGAGTGFGPGESPFTAATPAPSASPAPSVPSAPSATSGPGATSDPLAPSGPSATSGPLASPGSPGGAKAHATPARSRRRTATGAIAAVIAVLIIAAVIGLVLLH